MSDKRYFVVNSITLAQALNFLGFNYYVFNKPDGSKIYSFPNTESFRDAYENICKLRKKYITNK